jgi:hypothetical protein
MALDNADTPEEEGSTTVVIASADGLEGIEAQTPEGLQRVPTDMERYWARLAVLEPRLCEQVAAEDLRKGYAAGEALIRKWFDQHFPEIELPALLEEMGIRGDDVVSQLDEGVRRRVAVAMAHPNIADLVGDHAEVAMSTLETRYPAETIALVRDVIQLEFRLAAEVAFESHDMALALRELTILST